MIASRDVIELLRPELDPRPNSGQLENPVLTPYFKLGPSWLHFYHTSQVDSLNTVYVP